jgi:hypothetical protein
VLPAADFAVQAGQTRAGAAGGRALNPKPQFNHGWTQVDTDAKPLAKKPAA